jgi:hypothetical protein
MSANAAVLGKQIESRILMLRRQRVILDTDLSTLYGVTTKRLNEQVKRNKERFPADFMFQLTSDEKLEVVANCDHLANLKFSRTTPYAFQSMEPLWPPACSIHRMLLKQAFLLSELLSN